MSAAHFSLKGRIISKENVPLKNQKVLAYDDDPILNPDDFLGESLTDSNGFFRIDFDSTKFNGFLEALDQTPDVYILVKDEQGKTILNNEKTIVSQTQKEIEYHIRIVEHIPDPFIRDIYAGNVRRMISMLREVGNVIGIENTINLDLLRNRDLPRDIEVRLQNFVNRFNERNNNFDHFTIIVSAVIDSLLEEWRVGKIGYDGSQVPRFPRRESYDQVIIWPRKEEFKWA
ncbi:hypothetical protein BH18THE2_BH18THE2_13880 [soil metagenome]